jgi:hypothetical protein
MATFPTTGVEVKDNIRKNVLSNRFAVSQDSGTFDGGQKYSSEIKFDSPTIEVSVHEDNMAAVMSFLEGDRTVLHRFNLPGYNHFNRDDSDNYAYLLGHSEPVQVGMRWEFSIDVIWQADP